MSSIAENIDMIKNRIAEAARRVGRDPEEITLIAVSKTVAAARVREAVAAGLNDFGENYVQEAREKIPEIGSGIRWHMIGHLQTNKVKYVVPYFSIIHSVDSLRLAQEISRLSEKAGKTMDMLLEVNSAGEETKSGIGPDQVLSLIQEVAMLKAVRIRGLMTMPPFFEEPEKVRPYFQLVRELRDQLIPMLPAGAALPELSMGMSGDFEVAIEEGATMVRVGTAIFGLRGV
ncbi:MAG TPA: YggS family pyridoxal phosphate-dependent enzyme [Thermodesulfobacteriota bacterium]|nr:YggS family pyridoxal phosphate-dependent enzyme [Deltaproteobacteria bacterium]HNR13125.1 YggS family pyridoxal phosphate-dependent enzyme [Thermodesulfobacteriota bacterium]HNU70760.1 YggS family pyridoxal phosphate-dependent enzyme [Thermodesulfobacteriota bacterium]HOC37796.1 YggS family pyridoxal phosphate-dependent enzyme [Thermodesulfobacteriota bacterium]